MSVERTSSAVVIRIEDRWRDGTTRVWYVGPFMPHVGSAATSADRELCREENIPDGVGERFTSFETTFLAPGESDLRLN